MRSSPPSCRKTLRWYLPGTLENYKSLLKPVRCRHTDHHQRDSLFTSAIPRNSDDTESPKAPSTYFSRTLNSTTTTLLNYSTRPRIQLNLLYSPTLQPNFIRYQSQVKPSHTPLEAGISVKTTVDALTAQSVKPQGSHLPKVGGWNPGHRYTLK